MHVRINKFIAIALLIATGLVVAADRTSSVSAKEPAILQGILAAGQEESWTVNIKAGKEARLLTQKGRREVVADIYDSQNIAANEGVDEADWFPVAPGPYKVTLTNITGIKVKSGGKSAVYEFKFEVR